MRENCTNCGYVESEREGRKIQYFCTNLGADKCSEWVTEEDVCPEWVRLTGITKYYTAKITGIEGCKEK